MAMSRRNSDLNYDDEKRTVEHFLSMEELPLVVRVCSVESEDFNTKNLVEKSLLLQQVSKDPFAHIKVLKFYDNKKMQSEMGGEYVLEHETFVGNEYLLPLKFPGRVKYVRRPGSRGRYLTIKQVVGDCPAFVKAENETKTRLSSDLTQVATIPAKSILELKRIYTRETDDNVMLECSDGDKMYTFHENDEVNFTVFERHKIYSLTELSQAPLLPKVILFQTIDAEDAVLKDNELRSALLTMVEGPLEVFGFADVEYLICWIRNKEQKTYETVLIPDNMWNKIYVQKRCFTDAFEKQIYIKRKYRECLLSDFFRTSLYILPVNMHEVTWLRSPDLFKRNLQDANKLYEVVHIPFEDSSDDDGDGTHDHVYAEIMEPPPPLPPKGPVEASKQNSTIKKTQSVLRKLKCLFTPLSKLYGGRHVGNTENRPDRPPKPQLPGTLPRDKCSSSLDSRPLPNPLAVDIRDNKYTKLRFQKSLRVYETVNNSVESVLSPGEPEQSREFEDENKLKVNNVLKENQSAENFFQYSVVEVSFCFEHCGLQSLADLCLQQKLDGTFFKGFNNWNLFKLSRFDMAIVTKVIYQGWRPKGDMGSFTV